MLVNEKSMAYVIYSTEGARSEPVKGLTANESPLQGDAAGRTIYVWDNTIPARIYRLDPRTGRREFWMEVIPANSSGLLYGHIFVSPDGQTFAYHFRRILTNLFVAENLH
jgi:hypothetical protein